MYMVNRYRVFCNHSGYFAVTGYGNIFTVLPLLAVGCTGNVSVSGMLHWEGSIRQKYFRNRCRWLQKIITAFCYFTVTVQQSSSQLIAHPGQDVELLCTVTPSEIQTAAWIINHVVYTVQQLRDGIVTGYNKSGNNLIIENVMMNDSRNSTEYSCVIISSTLDHHPLFADILAESDPTILYVAGEYQITLFNLHCN